MSEGAGEMGALPVSSCKHGFLRVQRSTSRSSTTSPWRKGGTLVLPCVFWSERAERADKPAIFEPAIPQWCLVCSCARGRRRSIVGVILLVRRLTGRTLNRLAPTWPPQYALARKTLVTYIHRYMIAVLRGCWNKRGGRDVTAFKTKQRF